MIIYKGQLKDEETGDVFYTQTSYDSIDEKPDTFPKTGYPYECITQHDCIQDTNFSPTDYSQAWEKQ